MEEKNAKKHCNKTGKHIYNVHVKSPLLLHMHTFIIYTALKNLNKL